MFHIYATESCNLRLFARGVFNVGAISAMHRWAPHTVGPQGNAKIIEMGEFECAVL